MASTADLTRLLNPDDRFTLESRHFVYEGKSERTRIGLAIDIAERERAVRYGATEGDRFAPYDYELNGVYYDIKSTEGKWLTISYAELDFAQRQVERGGDVIYAVFKQLPELQYEFIGYVAFSSIGWMVRDGSSPYWSLSTVKSNLL